MFADITEAEYVASRHNAWDEDSLDAATIKFYRDERAVPHGRFLDAHSPNRDPGRLLDIGCGLGVFLERAAAVGWDVYGCDTSAAWVAHAQAATAQDRVVCAEPTVDIFGAMRFDLITLWDVIEHIYDPVSMLRVVRELLAPGGEVFLRTPNARYVVPVYRARRAFGHSVELGPLNHVVYFDAASLRKALDLADLRAQSWRVFPPPQVKISERAATVTLKNSYARSASLAARVSGGRFVRGSDLDALACPT
jgi:2-polyprenyl-3-methyl-5-hydroxy-6-metoxy-1,4-benzoquinol methylase